MKSKINQKKATNKLQLARNKDCRREINTFLKAVIKIFRKIRDNTTSIKQETIKKEYLEKCINKGILG